MPCLTPYQDGKIYTEKGKFVKKGFFFIGMTWSHPKVNPRKSIVRRPTKPLHAPIGTTESLESRDRKVSSASAGQRPYKPHCSMTLGRGFDECGRGAMRLGTKDDHPAKVSFFPDF